MAKKQGFILFYGLMAITATSFAKRSITLAPIKMFTSGGGSATVLGNKAVCWGTMLQNATTDVPNGLSAICGNWQKVWIDLNNTSSSSQKVTLNILKGTSIRNDNSNGTAQIIAFTPGPIVTATTDIIADTVTIAASSSAQFNFWVSCTAGSCVMAESVTGTPLVLRLGAPPIFKTCPPNTAQLCMDQQLTLNIRLDIEGDQGFLYGSVSGQQGNISGINRMDIIPVPNFAILGGRAF